MLVTQKRPRDLHWFHAGPLLFGDWGTSRLYVLGLAFYYSAHASLAYLGAIGVLMIAVAWAYTVVCRCFPNGGGVYAAAREIHPVLAVVGATLLLCGYIITVVISLVEAFHYFGLGRGPYGHAMVLWLSIVAIIGLGFVNWLGAKSAGVFAAVTAVLALGASLVLAMLCIPFLPRGLSTMTLHTGHDPWTSWVVFTKICLAMAGVEAVANMAGLMREPVAKTAKRTIWPVAAEVAIFNLVFGAALAGLASLAHTHVPDWRTFELAGQELPEHVRNYRDTGMKVVAMEAGKHWFGDNAGFWVGKSAAIIFGILLISAANTAIMAMVSVLYALGHDRELPRALTKLNYPGVPWISLIASCAVCGAVLVAERDVARLADLYVVGVCGAVTTTVLCCACNRRLSLRRGERTGLWILGLLLLAVTLTIVISKVAALIFAGSTVGLVLIARAVIRYRARTEEPAITAQMQTWLTALEQDPLPIGPSQRRIMLAARGQGQAEFAVDLAKRKSAALFCIYVRTLRLMDVAPGTIPQLKDDPDAIASLGATAILARQHGIPFFPIYVCSDDIAHEILDYTVTFGCDTLILGKTQRAAVARAVEGDVVTRIAAQLPSEVALIVRENTPLRGGHAPEPPPPPPSSAPPASPSGEEEIPHS